MAFVTIGVFAQTKNMAPNGKIIRLSTLANLELIKLDSLYLSAVSIDTSKCAFPNKSDSVAICFGKFMESLNKELTRNNFKWQKETRGFIRCYFNENGNIDYFTYDIKDTSFAQYKEFEGALKDFVSSYNFGLKCDKKYSQCGSGPFGRKK